jgi:hypothetical protein
VSKEVGIGLITKTVLHFLNIIDNRGVVLITNEVTMKEVLKIAIEYNIPDHLMTNKKVRIVDDNCSLGYFTAITFE